MERLRGKSRSGGSGNRAVPRDGRPKQRLGANVLPVIPRDIADWPLPFSELEEGYRAVSAFMPIAAQADELIDLDPLYGESAPAMPESR